VPSRERFNRLNAVGVNVPVHVLHRVIDDIAIVGSREKCIGVGQDEDEKGGVRSGRIRMAGNQTILRRIDVQTRDYGFETFPVGSLGDFASMA
jgi:hypothetical protein